MIKKFKIFLFIVKWNIKNIKWSYSRQKVKAFFKELEKYKELFEE